MKRLLLALLTIFGPCSSVIQAQNIEGQIIASQYGQWKISGYAPDTYTFAPTACRVQGGNSFFPAFTAETPILIVDGNPALNEIVTPSSVVINDVTCSIAISPIYHHNLPFYLTSATGGLQEAINANRANPDANTVILNNAWYQLGGSSGVISSVTGMAELGLIDVTTLPSSWYRWNGTQYVLVPVASTVTSVFGRTGAVASQTGDYTCAQVTGCPLIFVNSFAGRTGAVTPQTGDYTCAEVTGCPVTAAVSSVFGRTGVVAAQTGDYTCPQITGCGIAPVTGWGGSLTTAQGATDTTISITLGGGTIPTLGGYFWLDSEWEYFTGVTSLGGASYQLTGISRAQFATTAAIHASGIAISGMIQGLFPPSLTNFAWVGGTSTFGYFLAIDCPFATSVNGTIAFEVGCSGFNVSSNGSFNDSTSTTHYIYGPVAIGTNYSTTNSDYVYRIKSTVQVVQTGLPSQITTGIGFGSGIADAVEAVQAPSASAPTLANSFIPSGSTTNTYLCQGTDVFGNNIPGTAASINNLAASGWGSGTVVVFCPPIPGAVSLAIYRTAGVPNTGLIDTISAATTTFNDNYVTATTGTPNPTNTTVPVVCANGSQFCILSGTSSTPPVTCTSSQEGWEYHDVAASPAHHAFICESGTWTGVY